MKPIRFLNPAEQEMLDATRYCELPAPGLGGGFLNKIDSAVQDTAENPETWPILRFEIRRRLIHRFPYALLYRVDPDEIVVLATMHLHRHPSCWINRI